MNNIIFIFLSIFLFSCSKNGQQNTTPPVQSATVDLSVFFPTPNNSKWSISGIKMSHNRRIIEKYKIKAGINDVRTENGKTVVSFFRVGSPQKYSNDGPEDYYINAEMVANEDGCPILKNIMKKGDGWVFPTSEKITTKIDVVDVSTEFTSETIKYTNCIVIKITEYDINRVRLLTFAPMVGLVYSKVYSDSTDTSKANIIYTESRD